ncbi:MAG TPA: response regulator transcription factor [Aggregatilinea sp.]|uniref:response regulator transcription factor n=1 Tax=Aggregatilinea sp. TaxID=2806333 RepID=UPI002C01299B|nr:response regulator transcription factor [Aggregatilinea sp.]HML24299.1 response regulator transcription factor [Aggregatilinea sp.]
MPEYTRNKPFTVLVVDDHTMFRQAFVSLLETRPSTFHVVGEARTSCEALAMAHETRPELILLDVGLPDCSGIDIIGALRDVLPNCKIVMLSAFDDGQYVYDSICAGAVGYLTKNLSAQQVFDQLESAMQGYLVFSPDSVTQFALMISAQERARAANDSVPTPADFDRLDNEIIRLVAEGRTNVEIAHAVNVSAHTVKVHLTAILAALHLENRTQLAVYAKTRTSRSTVF